MDSLRDSCCAAVEGEEFGAALSDNDEDIKVSDAKEADADAGTNTTPTAAKLSKKERKGAKRAALKHLRDFQPLSKQAAHLLQHLGYDLKKDLADTASEESVHSSLKVLCKEPLFKQGLVCENADERVTCTPLPLQYDDIVRNVKAKYRIQRGLQGWMLESKVVFSSDDGAQLSLENLDAISYLVVRFAPPMSTVRLQADTHGAGNVFVGMIMSVNVAGSETEADVRIPVNLVSGDIGCGLSVIPLVCVKPGKAGELAFYQQSVKNIGDAERLRDFSAYVVATTRKTLLRGKAAEQGAFLASNLMEAASFYGFSELATWLDELRDVLEAVGTPFASYERSELDKIRSTASECAADADDDAVADVDADAVPVPVSSTSSASSAATTSEPLTKSLAKSLAEPSSESSTISAQTETSKSVGTHSPSASLAMTRDEAAKTIPLIKGLTYTQSIVLRYISRYAQSLGSSGNHFLEMSKDDGDKLWLVVHSGSRGLGAAVYNVIAEACRFLEGGYEVATGALAVFYQRAFDALCKFAKLNRVLCALAVLGALGYETNAQTLQTVMMQSPLFQRAIARFPPNEQVGVVQECYSHGRDLSKDELKTMTIDEVMREGRHSGIRLKIQPPPADACAAITATRAATLALLGGLVHNGLSCFVNDKAKTVLFVLKKGAIAMTRRAAASIVALRAGDGCLLWTLADATCATYETTIAEGVSKLRLPGGGYTQVYDSPDVLYAGHGAGRARPTSKTAKMSTFEEVVAFHDAQGMVGNISPGLLGDNPATAYNDVHGVKLALPLADACTMSHLKTLVAFKEGICHMPRDNEACAAYILKRWDSASPAEKLSLDLNLVQRVLGAAKFVEMDIERNRIFREFYSRFYRPLLF